MIEHAIKNAMDLVRIRIFAKNLQTYENRIVDPELHQLVEDHRRGLSRVEIVGMEARFYYHDPEQEFIRRLSL